MSNSGQGRRSKRGLKPGQRRRGQFTPGTNAHNGAVAHRGPDLVPRRPVVAVAQLQALAQEQLRDPRTGRLSRSKWAKGVRGAGLRDLVRGYTRALYATAHGYPQEATMLASAVTKLGEHFAAYLDDKAPTQGRTTTFVFATAPPDQTIPPEQGRRRLGPSLAPGEDGYVEVTEEDAL